MKMMLQRHRVAVWAYAACSALIGIGVGACKGPDYFVRSERAEVADALLDASSPRLVDVVAQPFTDAADGVCLSLGAAERVAAVSAEGDAWIAVRDEGEQTDGDQTLRVVDPWRTVETTAASFPAGTRVLPIDGLLAAQLQTGGTLRHLSSLDARSEQDGLDEIVLPSPLRATDRAMQVCGTMREPGVAFALTEDGLYERVWPSVSALPSTSPTWRRWRLFSDDAPPDRLLHPFGVCHDALPFLWMEQGGRLWLWQLDERSNPREVRGVRDVTQVMVGDDLGLVLLQQGEVLVGRPRWTRYRFGEASAVDVQLGEGVLWARLDDGRLLRAEWAAGTPPPEKLTWADVDARLPKGEAMVGMWAHRAGGLWVETDGGRLCHRSFVSPLRLSGLQGRSVQRQSWGTLRMESQGTSLHLAKDGEAIDEEELAALMRPQGDEVAGKRSWQFLTDFGEPGAHTWTLSTEDEAGHRRSRVVPYHIAPGFRQSYAEDIASLHTALCRTCHTGTNASNPRLGTYAAWYTHGERNLAQAKQDLMPPGGGVTAAQKEDLERWVLGGKRP